MSDYQPLHDQQQAWLSLEMPHYVSFVRPNNTKQNGTKIITNYEFCARRTGSSFCMSLDHRAAQFATTALPYLQTMSSTGSYKK